MLARLATLSACAALALTAPAAALADSAGDNQYQDPFANTPTQPKQHKKKVSTPTQTQTPTQAPAPTTTPAPSTPAAPAQTVPTPVPIAHAAGGSTLPRTGFPLLPVAALGTALTAAGIALKRRLA